MVINKGEYRTGKESMQVIPDKPIVLVALHNNVPIYVWNATQ